MKKLLIIALLGIAFTACKKQEPNTTTVTTEEKTTIDTVGDKVHTKTTVEETTKTDSTETTIKTGGVKVE